MVLGRLWQTIQALRQLDRKAPEMLRVAAAREAAQTRILEQTVRERNAISSDFVSSVHDKVEGLSMKKARELEARTKLLEEKLNSVTIDRAAIQAKAVSSVMDNWEQTLMQAGGHAANDAGSRSPSAGADVGADVDGRAVDKDGRKSQ